MKKTFVDVMLELPVDATLRDFLTSHGLPVPDGFAWDDTPRPASSWWRRSKSGPTSPPATG
jgi:hypothetical protein